MPELKDVLGMDLIEPDIVINGVVLDFAQAMTVRCAITSFDFDISENGLGDDEHGAFMTTAYKSRIAELYKIMRLNQKR